MKRAYQLPASAGLQHAILIAMGILISAQSAAVAKPNVLFIAVDDLNTWVGFMGGHPNAKTPRMDELATRGSVFLNAHCQAPICGPSRASVMTGLYPHSTGIYGHIKDAAIRRVNRRTLDSIYLPEHFQRHGYRTLGVGKLFHTHAPEGVFEVSGGREPGFGPKPRQRMHYEAAYTQTDWGAFPSSDEEMPDYRSAQWAAEQLAKQHEQPFFLAVGFLRPHVPWHVPAAWFDLHPLDSVQTPPFFPGDHQDLPTMAQRVNAVPVMPTTEWAIKENQWPAITQAYLASVSFVDACVGMVLDALAASQHAENTIVVLWSDHGYQLGEKNRFAKHALWNEATRVPLIIAGPRLPVNQRITAPVGLIDLYPTLIDLCDLAPRPQLEGASLVPLLKDPLLHPARPTLTAYGRSNYAVSGERFRYIRYEDGSEELYDLLSDPHEWRNLSSFEQFEPIKQRLARFLPSQEATWSAASFNPITDYFEDQKARMGVTPLLEP